jgi:hypothetical protein
MIIKVPFYEYEMHLFNYNKIISVILIYNEYSEYNETV